jgi:hypothetical protein
MHVQDQTGHRTRVGVESNNAAARARLGHESVLQPVSMACHIHVGKTIQQLSNAVVRFVLVVNCLRMTVDL